MRARVLVWAVALVACGDRHAEPRAAAPIPPRDDGGVIDGGGVGGGVLDGPAPAVAVVVDAAVEAPDEVVPDATLLTEGPRIAAVADDDGGYARQEQPSLNNACGRDADCFISGCAHYACSAVRELHDDCDDAPSFPPIASACGCVRGTCVWWRSRTYAGDGTRGRACIRGDCLGDLRCFGSSPGVCELACSGGGARCPTGETCRDYRCRPEHP